MLGHYGANGKASLVVALGLAGGGVGLRMGGTKFKEHGNQRSLKDDNIVYTSENKNDSANGLMGYGGALTLVNGSPFEWTLSSQTSYQMDTWKWPSVSPGMEIRPIKPTVYYANDAGQVKRKEST
jgi:hypothetical protein